MGEETAVVVAAGPAVCAKGGVGFAVAAAAKGAGVVRGGVGTAVAGAAGGAAPGETEHLVIVHQQRNIGIPPDCMNKMVSSFRVAVSVAADNNDNQSMIGQFGGGGEGKRSAVKAVYAVAFHVMREFCRLADAGHDQHMAWPEIQIGQRLLQ